MLQYFKSLVLALLLSVGFGSVGNAENHSSTSASFNRLTGIDLFGDDLTSMGVKGISLAECEVICSEDSSCKAYSFIEDKKWCFPKSGPGQVQPNGNVISGLRVRQEPEAECLSDVTHSQTDKPSELALGFCRSGLSSLADIEMLVSENTTKNNFISHEKFKIKHKVISGFEDWVLVYLKEDESEYNYSEIVGFNCSNNKFEELNTNSHTGNSKWTPNFLQYSMVLNSVCGFEGNYLQTLSAYENYSYLDDAYYNGWWVGNDAKDYLSVALAKRIQRQSSDFSVWSPEFWNDFETNGCSECGSSMGEISENAWILAEDRLNFLINRYRSLFGKIVNVSLTDLRTIDDDDFEKLWRHSE